MSVFLGLTLGALVMLVLLGFIANDEASAAPGVFKKAMSVSMEKVVGPYKGPITNGTWVGNRDAIVITVTNETTPTASSDRMLVEIMANSGSVTKVHVSLELNYTGTGSSFKGNITLNSSRTSFIYTSDGVEIGAKDGYTISVVRLLPLVQAMAHFNVDASGPTIDTTGAYSDYQEMDGGFYMKTSGSINLALDDSDPDADLAYFQTGSKVQYRWGAGTWTDWGGNVITTPSTAGSHTLHVKATDRFSQVTNLDRLFQTATIQDALFISSTLTYQNTILFFSNTTIKSSGSLTLTNCTLGFYGDDVTMVIEKGGSLIMKGPASSTSVLKIGSSGKNYLLESKTGSKLEIANTTILAGMNDRSNTLSLHEGIIQKSKMRDLRTPIMIRSGNVQIIESEISLIGSRGGIRIDLNHTWNPKPVNLKDLTIDGGALAPISIMNASVWKAHNSRDVYYGGGQNATYLFSIDRSATQPSNPYIQVPYFIDSRSANAVLRIEYNASGTWTLLSSFEKKDTISTEWIDGSSSVIDITSTPLVTDFRIIWNVTKPGSGCAYIQKPLYGASGVNPGTPTPKDNTWASVISDIVTLDSVTIKNASRSFVEVRSSGMVDITGLKAGGFNKSAPAVNGLHIVDSAINIEDSAIRTFTNGAVGIRSSFGAGDDWAQTTIRTTTISNAIANQSYGILSSGGSLSVTDVSVTDAVEGIKTTSSMVGIDKATVHAKSYGLDIQIPSGYIGTRSMDLNGVVARDHSEAGILVYGSISSDWDITVHSYEIASATTSPRIRSSGIGGVTFDVAGSGKVHAFLQGNVTDGNAHGIAVKNVPSGSVVNITGPSTTSTLMLDGLYIGAPCDVNVVNFHSKNNQKQGLFVGPGANLNLRGVLTEITGNLEGGVYADASSTVSIIDGNVSLNSGPGLTLMGNAIANINGVDMYSNRIGIDGRIGSRLEMTGSIIGLCTEQGIKTKGADLVFDTPMTTITGNGREGIFADGGSLDSLFLLSKNNAGDGIKLWNVRMVQMERTTSRDNGGNGLSVHIGTKALLGPGDNYGQIVDSSFTGNLNDGISLTYDPSTIDTIIEVGLTQVELQSNTLLDLDSPAMVRITWIMTGADILGSPNSQGKVRANMDVILSTPQSPKIRNEAITLLGTGNKFTISYNCRLTLDEVDITPIGENNRFDIQIDKIGSLDIRGGSLYHLGGINASEAKSVTMIDADIVDSWDTIVLGCPFTISGCSFDGFPGSAILIVEEEDGLSKMLSDTVIANSTTGIHVQGDVTALTITGCEIRQNDVGVLFDSENHLYINSTKFIANIIPIHVLSGNLSLFDSEIDKAEVKVDREVDRVDIGFTLTVRVVDEEGHGTEFTLNLTRGTGSASESIQYDIGKDDGYMFQKGLVSYTVFNAYVNDTYLKVMVQVSHIYDEKAVTFEHTSTRELLYVMFTPPKVTTNAKSTLIAYEDKGLKNGPENVRTWFQDSTSDDPNITFKAVSMGKNIYPYMTGSILNITLKRDFHGQEKVRITASDPHGLSVYVDVTIVVQPSNDVPFASNARILIEGVESTSAKTGDNLTAAWDFYDIDGDEQPSSVKLLWYMDGVMQNSLEGVETVRNVQPGQYWNFTIYPTDAFSYTSGKFGTPVNSPGIMVGNIAPVLESVTLSPENPRTEDTLKAIPGIWTDPDSPRVYFHYEWQKKGVGSGWIVLSAPDSPNLPGSYFSKGDIIQVRAWMTDGYSTSDPRTATVTIQNSPPTVISAHLEPERISERTQYVRVVDVETSDPDMDTVTLNFIWSDKGVPLESGFDILYSSKWSYPDHNPLDMNITVSIIPYDGEMGEGRPYLIKVVYLPSDSDGDGLFDDANGNGVNDPGDDLDDDNDGFNDTWEKLLMKDPTDPLSYPQDWDRDGIPDGDPQNSEDWMDLDDDGDGIPDSSDSYPLNYIMPGDYDRDGIGDDRDPDKDNDGVLAYEDENDLDPSVGRKAEGLHFSTLEIVLFIMLVLIVIAIGGMGYAVYNGQIKLPSNAPPEVLHEKGERPAPFRTKRDIALDALEDIDLGDMMVCSICSEVVKKNDESCPNCGSFFSADTEDLTIPEGEEFVAEEE
jgi:hypothetical protein